MFGRNKRNKPDFIETATARATVLSVSDSRQGLDFLVAFFSAVRPSFQKGPKDPPASRIRPKKDATRNLEILTAALHQHPILLTNLRHALFSQLIRTDLSATLTESGIPLARGFWQEFFGRLRHKLLPPLQNEHDFLYVLNRVFFRNRDYLWVESIPRESWIRFFESIGLSLHMDDRRILHQLLQSLKVLAFQVAQLGLEKEVWNYVSSDQQENNPFVEQNYRIHALEEWLLQEEDRRPQGPALAVSPSDMIDPSPERSSQATVLAAKIGESLAQCYAGIDHIREQSYVRGASLHQTYTLLILANRLDRISILVDLLDNDQHFDAGKFVDFFRMLVRNENRKNSIREFMSQSMGYLAYQIAEHKGSKGNKYITSTWAEYIGMMKSAMGGGAWVCLVVFIKNILTKLEIPLFWHGFLYSVNYSVGFLLIEETHTTLATKQPAFTASTVAGSLDTRRNDHEPNLYNLAVTVAKVSRSQIASFAGNLIVVFPGAWLIAWVYEKLVKTKIVSGEAAAKMLQDNHPWQSLSLLYACNAGVFLFLSGIIAGYVQNKIQYGHIAKRLTTHPILRLSLPADRLSRIATYIENHSGSIIGNIALGFLLGMAGPVGQIFGIHFDIRHITIAAGNTAIAAYGLGLHNIPRWYLLTIVLGVIGIGFFNFLVSFSLAFFVAVRSRGIRLNKYPAFLGILWRYFRSNPLDFIRPRRRSPETDN
jgi:site-specific recombinase